MAEYADRESSFDSSLGSVMGSWMEEVSKADLTRQQGWLEAVQVLATKDKSGKIPTITLASGLTDASGKAIDGADISFPIVLAMMGQQFAAKDAALAMSMNVSASTVDDTQGQQSGTAEGEASFGIGGLKATVKVSASFSESEDHKRESDYRATTSATVNMARVDTPEPIQRVLEAYMKLVDVECKRAVKAIDDSANTGGGTPAPQPSGG